MRGEEARKEATGDIPVNAREGVGNSSRSGVGRLVVLNREYETRGSQTDSNVECFDALSLQTGLSAGGLWVRRGRFTILNEWVATGVVSLVRGRFTVVNSVLSW
jgi:hypothetical protein